MLELRRLDLKTTDLTTAITNELINFGFPDSDKFAINALEQGKLLILLDGLDEVNKESRNDVINSIQNFIMKYDKNRYIASCRTAAYRSRWHQFYDVELADFDDKQIQQFIHNWFPRSLDREIGTAQRCWQLLNDPINAKSKELAHTPLLLTFLCLVYDRIQNFPVNRATLYRRALDILLEEWASEKRINPSEIYHGLNNDVEKILLSEIAYKGFINDQFFFTQQELVDQIREFLSDTVDKPKYIDGKSVLDSITTQQGILVERAEDIYSFSHSTLQEYLTAFYISRDVDIVRSCLEENLKDERWREVFILVAGMLQNSEKFLNLIQTEITKQTNILPFKVNALLNWADQIIDKSKANLNFPTKRSIALLIAMDCADAYKRFQEFDFHVELTSYNPIRNKALYAAGYCVWALNPECEIHVGYTPPHLRFQNFEKLSLRGINIFQEAFCNILVARLEAIQARSKNINLLPNLKQFVDLVYTVWTETLNLEREWINLSEEETEVLASYFYINGLLFECKKAAVRVSSNFWKNLEDKILTTESNVITLDKKAYPLMMHLSLQPKYDNKAEESKYDPKHQTSTSYGTRGSWCTANGSTRGLNHFFSGSDDDSQEDD